MSIFSKSEGRCLEKSRDRSGALFPSFGTNTVSVDAFSSKRLLDSENSHAFLLSKTAIQMENACKRESDGLNSTAYIPSLNGAKLKTGPLSSNPP